MVLLSDKGRQEKELPETMEDRDTLSNKKCLVSNRNEPRCALLSFPVNVSTFSGCERLLPRPSTGIAVILCTFSGRVESVLAVPLRAAANFLWRRLLLFPGRRCREDVADHRPPSWEATVTATCPRRRRPWTLCPDDGIVVLRRTDRS